METPAPVTLGAELGEGLGGLVMLDVHLSMLGFRPSLTPGAAV